MAETYSTYEAKAKFSEILRKVARGRTIRISRRGEPIAEIRPVRREPAALEQRISELREQGVLSASSPRKAARLKPVARRTGALRRFLADRNGERRLRRRLQAFGACGREQTIVEANEGHIVLDVFLKMETARQLNRGQILAEGLHPSDSPTRSLARRFAGALRSRGSLAMLARIVERASGLSDSSSPVDGRERMLPSARASNRSSRLSKTAPESDSPGRAIERNDPSLVVGRVMTPCASSFVKTASVVAPSATGRSSATGWPRWVTTSVRPCLTWRR